MDWAFIGIYLAVQMGIAWYLSRFISSEDDFFLGGRKVPTYALAFSIFATWFGAETCIGSSAAVFANGLSGSKAEPIGYGLCLLFSALFIAPKIWNAKYTTLGDFFKDRFSVSSEKILVWILIPSGLIWAAAQIRAFGQVISFTGDLNLNLAVTLATSFVIVYTLLGGMMGDIITDLIQGVILSLTLLAVFFFAIGELGGLEAAFSNLDSSRLSLVGEETSWFERLDSWMIPIFGSLISQELISRILSSKNKEQAVSSGLSGTWLYLFFGTIPILLGLIGYKFNLSLNESEQFLPVLAQKTLPHGLYIIFIGSLISAILSTIDSILLASSALISHNFLVPTFNITKKKSKLLAARGTLIGSGLVAYIMAIYGESVYEMVELASSFGTAGVLVSVVGGLFFARGSHYVANTVLIAGLVLSPLFEFVLDIKASFTLSIVCLIVIYMLGVAIEAIFVKNKEAIGQT